MSKSTQRKNVTRLELDEVQPTSGMANVTVQCLLLGIDLGWTATEMRNGVIRLTREHEGRAVAINLPTNQRSIKQGVGQSWIRKVIRYADPVRLAALSAMIEGWDSPRADEQERARVIYQGLRSTDIMHDHSVLDEIIKQEPPLEAVPTPEPEPEPEPVQQDETEQPAKGEPEVIKIKPWVARHSMRREGGEVYESRAVLERKWSDGSTDYACPRCEYANAEALSVARHYGGKHGAEHPTKTAQAETYVDPAIHWVPTERQQGRIHRLCNEMKAALTAIGPTMTVEQCAEWIVKHRDEQREHMVDEATELTPDQVLERIRRLVDHGAYADLMARIETMETEAVAAKQQADLDREHEQRSAQNAIDALEARLSEAERQVTEALELEAAARANSEEMEGRWRALRELLQD